MKIKYDYVCKCGKEIIGFSPTHLNRNIEIHEKLSKGHKERLKEFDENSEIILVFNNKNPNNIASILESHPMTRSEIINIGG